MTPELVAGLSMKGARALSDDEVDQALALLDEDATLPCALEVQLYLTRRSRDAERAARDAAEEARDAERAARDAERAAREAAEELNRRTAMPVRASFARAIYGRVSDETPSSAVSTASAQRQRLGASASRRSRSGGVRSWALDPECLVTWDLDFSVISDGERDFQVVAQAMDVAQVIYRGASEDWLLDKMKMSLFTRCVDFFRTVRREGGVDFAAQSLSLVTTRPDCVWLVNPDEFLAVHEHKRILDDALPASRSEVIEAWGIRNSTTRNLIAQVYGYMVMFGLKYAVASTTQHTCFFKRVDERVALAVSEVYDGSAFDDVTSTAPPRSARIAYLTFLVTAMYDRLRDGERYPNENSRLFEYARASWRENFLGLPGNWTRYANDATVSFMRGLTSYNAASRQVRRRRQGEADALPLSANQLASLLPLPWDARYSTITENPNAVTRRLALGDGMPNIIIKDAVRTRRGIATGELLAMVQELENEAAIYEHLRDLQGDQVPILLYGGRLGIGRVVVATLDAGEHSLRSPRVDLSDQLAGKARAALCAVHKAGVLHGDVALRNFVLHKASGKVRVLDFGRARLGEDPGQRAKELQDFEDDLADKRRRRRGGQEGAIAR